MRYTFQLNKPKHVRKGNVSLSATALGEEHRERLSFLCIFLSVAYWTHQKCQLVTDGHAQKSSMLFMNPPNKPFAGKQRVEEKAHSAF